ncbi:HAD hydrolase-like protein [Aureimonas mangrovi]|uniref:HAD hydrolase-like protein n=1 Tax=Aureimonas mangrovi TaxID=2758041 RepID=UPI00163D4C0F|nr:HAD hydrolase-like protein [Aureimonas mangrovi]
MSQLRVTPPRPSPVPYDPAEDGPLLAVFDLDGTLVDSAPDLAASLNHCLRGAGMDEIGLDDIRPNAGKGVRVMLEYAYDRAGVPLDEDLRAAHTERFLAHYQAHIADLSQPFPGTVEMLERLAACGVVMAVCTNKFEGLARSLLDALGLSCHFATVCGADTFARRKPDPIHLLGTIERAGSNAARAVMIGDTMTDIDAAFACGIPSILADFGYEPDETARRAATRVISDFAAIDADMLERLLARRLAAG